MYVKLDYMSMILYKNKGTYEIVKGGQQFIGFRKLWVELNGMQQELFRLAVMISTQ